ncbi:Pycsar system effector family protein [Roseivirga sp. BDSF3-8]|uniref:Pycsar system effector family protein n=1 Tax=Roseivirga sp. BDSF3-8 TaxID=3241598 RepID=UPI0035322A3E
MIPETELLDKTQSFSKKYFEEKVGGDFSYHNLDHTVDVVEAVKEIGEHTGLKEDEFEIVLIAAWLHDLGYAESCDDHEERSVEIGSKFLKEQEADKKLIEKVSGCIRATRMPHDPKNQLEEVLCDADLYHLSTDTFEEKSELLRKEVDTVLGKKLKKKEWLNKNVEFFQIHSYFTDYGRNILSERKRQNLEDLQSKVKKKKKKQSKKVKKLEKKVAKLKAKKDKRPDRGIETMFRTTSRNHIDLSAIADNKANIMISINAIIVSILVSVLIRKFEDYPNLIIPTIIMTTVCLLTIIFSVLATRPNITSGRFTKDDIHQRRTNLLFFGNFHRMQLDDFHWGVNEIMKDRDFLYGSMIKDIYFLGKVLGRKYQLLRVSYTIFMYGFVIAVLSFAIAIGFFPAY